MIQVLDYTHNPLTFMGTVASSCWNSKPSARIGEDCIKSNHGRVLEFPDVTVIISDYSARVMREIYTHCVGTSRLQASTRYINYGEFDYYIPNTIENNPNRNSIYSHCMNVIQETYRTLQKTGVPKEDLANLLPLGMTSKMVLKINARAILHMAELRLCNRAYKEYREFMNQFINVVAGLDSEWETIMSYAKCKCDKLGYCDEKNGCGKYPKKEE
jgi:thymidylate synthase (FAD)